MRALGFTKLIQVTFKVSCQPEQQSMLMGWGLHFAVGTCNFPSDAGPLFFFYFFFSLQVVGDPQRGKVIDNRCTDRESPMFCVLYVSCVTLVEPRCRSLPATRPIRSNDPDP